MSQTPLGGLSYIPRAFAEVAREDGLRGFVRGLSPTCMCPSVLQN